jgi:hypothetical protein
VLLGSTRVFVAGVAAEPVADAVFDELANRQLPALLAARAQTGELPRIHAERARHRAVRRQIFFAFVHAFSSCVRSVFAMPPT